MHSLATISIAEDWKEVSGVPNMTVTILYKTYLFLTEECIQDPAEHRLQASADHMEREPIVDTVLVELWESLVHFKGLLHEREAIMEGDVERPPHISRGLAERPLTRLDLLLELVAAVGAASIGIDQDVACVLHADGAVKVYFECILSETGLKHTTGAGNPGS